MFLGQCHQSQTPLNALIINSVPCDRFMWQNKYNANIANIYQFQKQNFFLYRNYTQTEVPTMQAGTSLCGFSLSASSKEHLSQHAVLQKM